MDQSVVVFWIVFFIHLTSLGLKHAKIKDFEEKYFWGAFLSSAGVYELVKLTKNTQNI